MIQLVKYFKEVREELQKVSWPTREQTTHKTALVIGVSIVVGVYIGGLDFLFTTLSKLFIR